MISIDLSLRHDDQEPWRPDFTETIDVNRTGKKVLVAAKTVGTSAITIPLSDLSAPGYAFVKNIGTSGNIDFGFNDGSQRSLMTIMPGQFALFPVKSGLTLGAQGSAAGCQLQVIVYEA